MIDSSGPRAYLFQKTNSSDNHGETNGIITTLEYHKI